MVNVAEPAAQTFGKYQIIERIATGGMAEIYKAKLEGIGGFQRTFAIKRVLPHLSTNTDYIAMLVDEAKIAGLLSHANIVQILDLGQVDDTWYIAMEYVDGTDLGALLERVSERGLVLPVPHATFITIELLKGLDYAHKRTVMRGGRPVPLDIIHRDLSPSNILIAYQGEVKLTDFGIARASLKVMETQAGVIKGRFDYMSPEQALGSRELDQRSDLFSVGVLLYQMLTGTNPFASESELDTLDNVRDGAYVPVRERNPDVPKALEVIVDRVLKVDRDQRFMTASAFKEALDTFFQDAGFLFNQGTLATYVQGVFPESGRARAPQVDDLPPDPGTEEVDLLEYDGDEGPTRLMDSAAILQNLPDTPAPAPTPEPPTVVDLAEDGEEETVIKPNVLAKARRDEGRRRITDQFSRPSEDEAETVVGRLPSADSFPTPQAGTPPTAPPKRSTVSAPSRPLGPSRDPSFRDESAVRRGVPFIVAALLAIGAGLIGFAFGTGAGAGGTVLVTQAQQEPARLDVQAPDGARVTVNGIQISEPINVGANQPQTLVVEHEDGRWETTVSVAPGQTRLVVVDTAVMEMPGDDTQGDSDASVREPDR